MSITVVTSNVNGIRAANRHNVGEWVSAHLPDVWCLQEVRAPQSEIHPIVADFAARYVENGKIDDASQLHLTNEVCAVKGRAGVALLTILPVVGERFGLPGLTEAVDTGRWIEVDLKTPQGYVITVVSVYVHSGNVADPDKMMQKYRFLEAMTERMAQLQEEAARGGRQAVLCGDFNIAHTPLDIKNAKANEKNSGFLPAERAYIDRWLNEEDFIDVQRELTGPIQGPYTWWSQRGRAFDNNVGWRIDYQFATPELAQTAESFVIDRAASYETRWSDHAALRITYNV